MLQRLTGQSGQLEDNGSQRSGGVKGTWVGGVVRSGAEGDGGGGWGVSKGPSSLLVSLLVSPLLVFPQRLL